MQKNVYVIGVFDLYHRGHVELLKRAKRLGGRLVVAVNGDSMVESYKRKPIYSQEDRLALIQSCRYVDEAFIVDGYDNKANLIRYKISTIVHGDDWERNSYLDQIRVTEDFLAEHGIELVLLSYTAGVSTSDIMKKIRAKEL